VGSKPAVGRSDRQLARIPGSGGIAAIGLNSSCLQLSIYREDGRSRIESR
jgi:hypothetical protein